MTDTLYACLETDADWCAAWVAAAPMTEGVLTPFGVVDPESVSASAAIDMLIGLERTANWVAAQQTRFLARLARRPGSIPARPEPGSRFVSEAEVIKRGFLREEIALALHLPPVVVAERMQTATTVVERLPATLALMDAGNLPYGHAACLADAVATLDEEQTAQVETRVLVRAAEQTRSLFRASLRRAVAKVDPDGTTKRAEAAREDRRVAYQPETNQMATITAFLPADDAVAVRTAVQSVADALARCDILDRTADQLRADALVAICAAALQGKAVTETLGPLPTEQGHKPTVLVSVALSTLLHLDEQPGELAGYGPITADLARRIAADQTGTWRRIVTDDLGNLIDYGTTRYRPPAGLRDHIIARDRTERFPGSTRGPRKSELDHIQARIDGGETNERNLHLLSKRSQTLKHDAGWQVERLPDGTTHWTTPQGRHYYQPPDPYPIDTTATVAEGNGT